MSWTSNDWTVDTARAQLGDAAFAAAWEAGRQTPLEQAIAFTLEEVSRAPDC